MKLRERREDTIIIISTSTTLDEYDESEMFENLCQCQGAMLYVACDDHLSLREMSFTVHCAAWSWAWIAAHTRACTRTDDLSLPIAYRGITTSSPTQHDAFHQGLTKGKGR